MFPKSIQRRREAKQDGRREHAAPWLRKVLEGLDAPAREKLKQALKVFSDEELPAALEAKFEAVDELVGGAPSRGIDWRARVNRVLKAAFMHLAEDIEAALHDEGAAKKAARLASERVRDLDERAYVWLQSASKGLGGDAKHSLALEVEKHLRAGNDFDAWSSNRREIRRDLKKRFPTERQMGFIGAIQALFFCGNTAYFGPILILILLLPPGWRELVYFPSLAISIWLCTLLSRRVARIFREQEPRISPLRSLSQIVCLFVCSWLLNHVVQPPQNVFAVLLFRNFVQIWISYCILLPLIANAILWLSVVPALRKQRAHSGPTLRLEVS